MSWRAGNLDLAGIMADEAGVSGGLFRGPPAYVARTPWSPFLGVLATLAIIGVGAMAAVIAANPAFSPWLPGLDSVELVALGAWQGLAILLTLAVSALLGGRVGEVLALGRPRGAPRVYLTAILLLIVLNGGVSVVQYFLFPHDMYTDLRPFVRFMTGSEWLLALLVVGIGAPLSEELLFRGFLLSALARSRLTFAGASLVSTALWTVLHASYTALGIAEVFLIGLFFCWLLWRTGSLRVAIFCHALYNSFIVLLLRYVPLPA